MQDGLRAALRLGLRDARAVLVELAGGPGGRRRRVGCDGGSRLGSDAEGSRTVRDVVVSPIGGKYRAESCGAWGQNGGLHGGAWC